MLAEAALERFEFEVCEWSWRGLASCGRAEEEHRRLVIQFRHSKRIGHADSRVRSSGKDEPLGFVNIAGRLICKVK